MGVRPQHSGLAGGNQGTKNAAGFLKFPDTPKLTYIRLESSALSAVASTLWVLIASFLSWLKGALYPDGTSGKNKDDDMVPPGQNYTYVWPVREEYAPAPADANCLTWVYHSHIDAPKDICSGLIGPLLVCKEGRQSPHPRKLLPWKWGGGMLKVCIRFRSCFATFLASNRMYVFHYSLFRPRGRSC